MEKIAKYYREARGRARQRKSPWNFLLIVLSFICMGGIWYLLFKCISALQHHLIPADAIYSSSTNLSEVLMSLPLFFPSMFIGMMLSNLIVWCIPFARRVLDAEAKGIKGGSFKNSMKLLFIGAIVSIIILMPVSVLGIFDYFYVAPSGISIRTLFSQKEKHYDWSDIVKIHGKFWDTGSGSPDAEYVLYMRDGRKIDLSVHFYIFLKAYDKIKPFIRAQSQVSYDYNIRMPKNFHSEGSERFIKIIQGKD